MTKEIIMQYIEKQKWYGDGDKGLQVVAVSAVSL